MFTDTEKLSVGLQGCTSFDPKRTRNDALSVHIENKNYDSVAFFMQIRIWNLVELIKRVEFSLEHPRFYTLATSELCTFDFDTEGGSVERSLQRSHLLLRISWSLL